MKKEDLADIINVMLEALVRKGHLLFEIDPRTFRLESKEGALPPSSGRFASRVPESKCSRTCCCEAFLSHPPMERV